MLLEKRYREGRSCKPLESRPERVYDDIYYVWEAFWILHKSRNYAPDGSPLGIFLTEIKAWIDIFEIENTSFFVSTISRLDSIYRESTRKKQKEQEDKEKKKVKSGGYRNKRRN
ncbi:MAG: hypothetical protein A2Y53_05655 [Chloroflexi bacterium RBG_16_47_49]|nr:MAG: hypothetical protein A2Y53_05655 [Chloroflexi bacterium RBG_16_47_49]